MTYRDDDAASLRPRTDLAREIERGELTPTERHDAEDEIAAIDAARIEAARARLPQVARAKIASPCSERWDTMLGDGAVRACSRCEKKVFDLSQMTLGQAEALIAENATGDLCVRLYRRADGTMLFSDCVVGARGVVKRDALRIGAAIAIGGATLAWTSAPAPIAASAAPRPSSAEARAAADAFLHAAARPVEPTPAVLGMSSWGSVVLDGFRYDPTAGGLPGPSLMLTVGSPVALDLAPFDTGPLLRAMRAQGSTIEARYQRALDHQPELAGRIAIRLTLRANGEVGDVVVVRDFTGASVLASFIAHVADRVRLPVGPPEPSRYEVSFDLVPDGRASRDSLLERVPL
jgi:hypothetical protein